MVLLKSQYPLITERQKRASGLVSHVILSQLNSVTYRETDIGNQLDSCLFPNRNVNARDDGRYWRMASLNLYQWQVH